MESELASMRLILDYQVLDRLKLNQLTLPGLWTASGKIGVLEARGAVVFRSRRESPPGFKIWAG